MSETVTNSVQHDLRSFASRLFEECGGLVEWDASHDGGMAMIPQQLAQIFGVKEEVPLSPRQENGGICLGLASEFLDRSNLALQSLIPRVGQFTIPDHYLKTRDLQELIERTFTWQNARVRIREAAPKPVTYHTWWFFATLKSEDVWESRLGITLNTASKAPVELPELLDLPDLEPSESVAAVNPTDTFDRAARLAQSQVLRRSGDFITRMEARLERDRKRLRDYYGALQNEAGATKRRAAAVPTEEELAARHRIVELELQRKTSELAERYAMSASLEPLAMVSLEMAVMVVELTVQRKQEQRTHWIYWNPLTRHFEPLGCSGCDQGVYSMFFTDDDVEPLCVECQQRHNARAGNRRVPVRPK